MRTTFRYEILHWICTAKEVKLTYNYLLIYEILLLQGSSITSVHVILLGFGTVGGEVSVKFHSSAVASYWSATNF